MNEEYNENYFMLSIMANYLQILDFILNVKQTDNDSIMKHLNLQDRILEGQNKELQRQTNIYLKKIVEQNDEIIRLLTDNK